MPPQQSRHDDPQEELREPLLVPSATPAETVEQATTPAVEPQTPAPHNSRRNVTLTLAYTLFAFAGSSIWGSNVLAAYVYFLRNGNAAAVGYITGIMGVANLVSSFPAGWLADSQRRDKVLQFASIIRAVAILVTLYAVFYRNYVFLLVGLGIWGSSRGTANTALGAIFADSIPQGQRSYYFTQRTILRTTGSTAGPIVSLAMFALLGDHWTLKDCSIVLSIGQAISIPAMIILCFFNDDDVMKDDNENGEQETPLDSQQEGNQNDEDDNDGNETLDAETLSSMLLELEPATTTEEEGSMAFTLSSWYMQRRIPILVATTDIITGLASGMSIKYFPIFFVENLKLGPVMVQLLYILGPIAQAILMRISQRLSLHFGRCHVSAAFRWVGIILMFAMIGAYHCQLPVWSVCIFYVLRTGFVNSTKALTRSLLMDNVPKEERGRWSAIESVNTLSWSGSAVLGGFLVGAVGLLPLFVTTACLQLCATFPLIALFAQDNREA